MLLLFGRQFDAPEEQLRDTRLELDVGGDTDKRRLGGRGCSVGAEEGKRGIVLDSVEVGGEVALKRCEAQGGATRWLAPKIVT